MSSSTRKKKSASTSSSSKGSKRDPLGNAWEQFKAINAKREEQLLNPVYDNYEFPKVYFKEVYTKKDVGEVIVQTIKDAASTFEQRNSVYGNNFLNVGGAMKALFPEGITLKTKDDFDRFHLFELAMVKASRYANNFSKGGHPDSIHDMGIYCFMLEGISNHKGEEK